MPWEARLAFSFIGNAVRLMDVDPIEDATKHADDRSGSKPAIASNLAQMQDSNGGPESERAASITGGPGCRGAGR